MEEEAIFDQIRAASAAVAASARQIEIVSDQLEAYATSLPLEELAAPCVEPEHHYLGHGAGTLAYVLCLDAVNFGSGYFPHLRPREGLRGYFLVAHALKDHFEANGPWSAAQLVELGPEDCAEIFGQDFSTHGVSSEDLSSKDLFSKPAREARRELMVLFSQALRDLGRLLLADFGASFEALVDACEHSAAKLLEILRRMPLYRDVATYDSQIVPFYKRAQITAADLWLAFEGQGPGRFDDLHELTLFADNLVPHVLRLDGVLRYDDALAEHIDQGRPIAANSPEEVELRACALHAVELMVEALASRGNTDLTVFELDNYLWHRGQDPRYAKKPRHHTRTVYY
jgi:hypothetical protein